LQTIATAIRADADWSTFISLAPDAAIDWMRSSNARPLFEQFVETNKHRCDQEVM
jgi:hypothetical protein